MALMQSVDGEVATVEVVVVLAWSGLTVECKGEKAGMLTLLAVDCR